MLDFITKKISKIFGTKSDRDLKEIQPILDSILAEFPKLANISNDELRAKTLEFKKRIAEFSSKERNQVTEVRIKIESDTTIGVEAKEALYEEIDGLEKIIIEKNKEIIDDLLPEAFAVMKETAKRFKENTTLEVTATQMDRDLAAQRDSDRKSTRLNSSHAN